MTSYVEQEAAQPVYLLAWIPESLLNEKGKSEWDKFTKIEEHAVSDDEDEGTLWQLCCRRGILNRVVHRCCSH